MERELPEFELYGRTFLVDVELLKLRDKDDPENTISFLNMEDKGTHYRIDYNYNDALNVDVPSLRELDPVGMAAKYNCSISEMEGKTDFEIMVDQQALKMRLAGALPQIDIAGDTFFVDWRLKQLRAKDDMAAPPLNLGTMDMNGDETSYICAYHIPTKSEYLLDVSALELPKDVVIIEIPFELKLDPVGVARELGLADIALLRRFPMERELKATVVPLSATDIPKLIEGNKMKQQEQESLKSKSKGRKLK